MADVWHYTNEGKRMEPVTAGELQHLADAGYRRPDDLVWTQGMSDWAAASGISGLFPKSATAAVAPVAQAPIDEAADDPPATFEVARPARRRRPDPGDADDEPRSADADEPLRTTRAGVRGSRRSAGGTWR